MRILVIGAGAVGGYFGGRLAQANRNVTFLVRAKRGEQIKANGLQILSSFGDLTLRPKTVSAQQIDSTYDLIFLGVKSYALAAAIDDFATALGPETMIFPALNGMRHIDLLVKRFGDRAVLGGVCMVASEIDANGCITQLSSIQKLVYGERDGKITPRLEHVHEALSGAGFETAMSQHIVDDMWQKWVQLATLGGLTCLFRGSVGQVATVEGGADLSVAILRECCDIAKACGHPQRDAFIEQQRAELTNAESTATASMYRDLKKGDRVEADTIIGELLRLGNERGLRTPLLQAAYVNLSVYELGQEATKTAAG